MSTLRVGLRYAGCCRIDFRFCCIEFPRESLPVCGTGFAWKQLRYRVLKHVVLLRAIL